MSSRDAFPLAYPQPSGPHPVGVTDGELLDTHYPPLREQDADGRRLMVRVWYPAGTDRGERRPYLTSAEADVAGLGITGDEPPLLPAAWMARLGEVLTHGLLDAPPAGGIFPTLVFSHGGLGHVSQNTPLMEHLASHGYVVWSLAHPGESAGVVYPDGHVVTFDESFRDVVFGHGAGPVADARLSDDIGVRLAATRQMLDDQTLGPWQRRWVDDTRALLDAVVEGTVRTNVPDVAAMCDPSRVGTLGMSFGGATAASVAQVDKRVSVAVNLDGGHYLSDLLDADIRVPLLELTSDLAGWLGRLGTAAHFLEYNEFFYESFTTSGLRRDVVRLRIPGITHLELTDFLLLPAADRGAAIPGGGIVDSLRVVSLLNNVIQEHLDNAFAGDVTRFSNIGSGFPELERVDLAPLRTWAADR